jgi:hypothetical protein
MASYESGALENRTPSDGSLTLTQKVFAKLLCEPENQYCFDCGKLHADLIHLISRLSQSRICFFE